MKNRTILFVDDEPEILNSLKRQFRKQNFTILTADSGEAGMKILEEHPVSLVISDERMPEMSGVEFLQDVKKEYPDTIRIVLSGYADSNAIINAINKGEVFRFVTKPWDTDVMLEVIEQAFAQYDVIQRNKEYMKQIIEENLRLRQEIEDRTTVLELTPEILEDLPVPVLVVGKDNNIVFFNRKMSVFGGETLSRGDRLTRIFSEETRERILKGFLIPGGQEGLEITEGTRSLKLLLRSLRNHDQYKGILIIEKID